MAKSGVYIIGCSDQGEAICAASGRISTQQGTALEIFERSHDEEKNKNLISKVTKSGHASTVEHIFFNLAFENVSVVVEQFMIEFRLASFTVKSRRYVDFADSGYFVPEFSDEKIKETYKNHMNSMFSLYSTLCEAGIPKEDARFVLPYCFYSNFFCSLGGRELLNVIRAMIYGRGKKIPEIYNLGLSLLEQCREKAPGIFLEFEERNCSFDDSPVLPEIEEIESDLPSEAVEILAYTPNPEKKVAVSALIEKGNYSTAAIEKALEDKETLSQVVNSVVNSGRPRALESATFTIRFNDVSLSSITHFARHRMQSICIPSLSTAKRDNYIIPASVRENEELLNLYVDAFERNNKLYNELKENDISESDLVYVLLSGNVLDIVTTMNARELKLFLRLRTCTRAQWEIRELATELLFKLRKISPVLFATYGPSCVCDKRCPEGRMSCGRMIEMNEKFK